MPVQHEKSQHGCWTCKLRKKKCDERLQSCQACEIRGITCHGYGPKPGWMDGGAREKKVLTELQRTIKENLKRKRSYHPIPPNPVSDAAPGAVPISILEYPTATIETLPLPITPPSSNYGASPSDFPHISYSSIASAYDDLLFHPISSPCGPGVDAVPQYVLEFSMEEFSNTLLMNFLDSVFPLQYSCYTHSIPGLGRGWLLALLTRTKALHHTALALSALFTHTSLRSTGRLRCTQGYWQEMNRHHTLALRELQAQIAGLSNGDAASLKGTIETVACIMQLVSIELLRGSTDSWQIHLRAACSLLPTLAQHIASSGLTTNGRPSLAEYKIALSRAPHDFPPHPDDIACDFLISYFIWYDIIACASTRKIPCLEDNYGYINTSELSNIMGCESWVMTIIYRISALQRWKVEQDPCHLDVDHLSAHASELERLLKDGLTANNGEMSHSLLPHEPARRQNSREPTTRTIHLITRIFALSALTYLHTVVRGPNPTDSKIKESVEETIDCFRDLTDLNIMRNLVWPFCVTACMATGLSNGSIPKDMDGGTGSFFAELSKPENIEGASGNITKAWEVAAECWKLREQGQDVDWVDGMKSLRCQVLLI